MPSAFLCSLAVCALSLKNMSVQIICPNFSLGFLAFLLNHEIFWILVSFRYIIYKCLLSFHSLLSHEVRRVLWWTTFLMKLSLCTFSLLPYSRNHCQIQCHKALPCPKSFTALALAVEIVDGFWVVAWGSSGPGCQCISRVECMPCVWPALGSVPGAEDAFNFIPWPVISSFPILLWVLRRLSSQVHDGITL